LARRLDVSDEELQRLESGDLATFSAREKTALEFAERLTLDSNETSSVLFDELRRHFSEGEVVEIAAVAGLFNYFNRVNNALQMEPTR
jgi:alkylhydroperoxidase family enzyme